MDLSGQRKSAAPAALLVAPNRELAGEFSRTLAATGAFQILADLKNYPTRRSLEKQLRQLKPEVVLLDLSADPETAERLIGFLASLRPAVYIICLHQANDPELVLRALRLGANEFLHAPFDEKVLRDAVDGILRLRQAEASAEEPRCRMVALSSAKPGSGASTLACHTALALRKITGARILLADLDLTGGTVGFCLKLTHAGSLVDALESHGDLDAGAWASLTADCQGVDVLLAPGIPKEFAADPDHLRAVLKHVRGLYDWVILDLPTVFRRDSLLALAEADRAFLVSTAELPSLHLVRRAVTLLERLGIDQDRLRVLMNRINKGGSVSGSDLKNIVNCPVECCFPDDYSSLHKAVALGEPLDGECLLGRAIAGFAGRLARVAGSERRGPGFLVDARPAFAGA